MKLLDYIKLGIGFYIGYTLAQSIDNSTLKIYNQIKDRITKGM